MSPCPVPASSKIYVNGDVTVPSYVTAITDDVLEAAIVPVDYGDPQSADWKTDGVQWRRLSPSTPQVLVGPGTAFDFSGSPGAYLLYFRITDNPEVPVLQSGFVIFT